MTDDLAIEPQDLPLSIAVDTVNMAQPHVVLNVHGSCVARFSTREEAEAYVNKVSAPAPVASGLHGPGPTAEATELMQDDMHGTGGGREKETRVTPKEKLMPKKKKRAAKKRELAPVVKKTARKTAGVKKAAKRRRR